MVILYIVIIIKINNCFVISLINYLSTAELYCQLIITMYGHHYKPLLVFSIFFPGALYVPRINYTYLQEETIRFFIISISQSVQCKPNILYFFFFFNEKLRFYTKLV